MVHTIQLGDVVDHDTRKQFLKERKWYVIRGSEALAAFVNPADAEAFAQYCEDRAKPLPNVGN